MLFIYIFLFKTIYAYDGNRVILGYTCTQMIWYYAAVAFFYCFVWCEPDKEISDEIISGYMAVRLTKPISVIKSTFLDATAFRVVNLFLLFLPTFAIYALLIYPDFLSITAFFKYIIMNCFSFILFYLFSFLVGITAFRFQSIGTLQSVKTTLILMAGVYIPFDFLPGTLQAILKGLPFQYIYYVPVQFFLNKPETRSMDYFMTAILGQAIWIIVFYILCKVSWRIAVKRFYSVGG